MQFTIGRQTLRTVLFVAGIIFVLLGLGYNVLELNPTGKIDLILFVLGALFIVTAMYTKEKHWDK